MVLKISRVFTVMNCAVSVTLESLAVEVILDSLCLPNLFHFTQWSKFTTIRAEIVIPNGKQPKFINGINYWG